MSQTILHLVLSVGQSVDGTFHIIASPIGVFRNKNEAIMVAQAEMEMGEIIVENISFKQITMMSEITVSKKTDEIWVVWSNAFSKNGTGNVYNKIAGAFLSHSDAVQCKESLASGFQEVAGHYCEVFNSIKRLDVK
jgi:hypothetical protein